MASLVLSRQMRCRVCKLAKHVNLRNKRYASTKAYYVLLPEIPTDTPETNSIMQPNDNPKFSDLTPDKVITGCAKLAIQYDVEMGKHIDNLKDGNFIKSFDNVFDPIEKLSIPMNYAWKTAKNLSYVQGNTAYKTAFQRVHRQVERAKTERWLSEPLYNAVKEVRADKSNLSKHQSRLVDMYLLEARLNGIDLTGEDKKKFTHILGNLIESKNHFRSRVMLSQNMFSQTFENFEEVVDLPKPLVRQMALDKNNPSRGPWRMTLNQDVYQPFLEFCSHRMMRWNVWQAYNSRSSMNQTSQNLSNHNLIKEIRTHRKDIAMLLGYENFAEMSMETKMAGSVENVLSFLESLRTKFQPIVINEVQQLQDFANSEGFSTTLECWDMAYWRRRQRENLFRVDQSELAEFFPYPKVLQTLFSVCRTLFGVDFVDKTSTVDVWDKDVTYYAVIDTDTKQELAGLYIDPHSRPGVKMEGAWVESARERSDLVGTSPLTYLNLSLSRPLGDHPALMTPGETSTLFFEMGLALQQLLTVLPYSEISGLKNVEVDTLQVCGHVLSLLFWQPSVLKTVSGHWQTGQELPDPLVERLLQERQHMAGYDLMRNIYLSAFDMEMYISEDYWQTVMQNIWPEFMPLPLSRDDNHPCSFSEIFSEQSPAAYYSVIWSEMLAADIVTMFTDSGLDADLSQAAGVGRRFRETYLAEAGGISANELFRRFRGRDPSIEPFVSSH